MVFLVISAVVPGPIFYLFPLPALFPRIPSEPLGFSWLTPVDLCLCLGVLSCRCISYVQHHLTFDKRQYQKTSPKTIKALIFKDFIFQVFLDAGVIGVLLGVIHPLKHPIFGLIPYTCNTLHKTPAKLGAAINTVRQITHHHR